MELLIATIHYQSQIKMLVWSVGTDDFNSLPSNSDRRYGIVLLSILPILFYSAVLGRICYHIVTNKSVHKVFDVMFLCVYVFWFCSYFAQHVEDLQLAFVVISDLYTQVVYDYRAERKLPKNRPSKQSFWMISGCAE